MERSIREPARDPLRLWRALGTRLPARLCRVLAARLMRGEKVGKASGCVSGMCSPDRTALWRASCEAWISYPLLCPTREVELSFRTSQP